MENCFDETVGEDAFGTPEQDGVGDFERPNQLDKPGQSWVDRHVGVLDVGRERHGRQLNIGDVERTLIHVRFY